MTSLMNLQTRGWICTFNSLFHVCYASMWCMTYSSVGDESESVRNLDAHYLPGTQVIEGDLQVQRLSHLQKHLCI